MTTPALSWLPLPCPLDPDAPDEGPQHNGRPVSVEQLAALHRAADAGQAAAGWVRKLAAHQADDLHARVLTQAAEAIERASSSEIIPGSDGELCEELRYALDGYVVLGAPTAEVPPVLSPGERTGLAAVVALAAAMPTTVLNSIERDLPALAEAMDDAVAAGRTAANT